MATDLTIKLGDTRDWRIAVTDSAGTALSLTSATVEFRIRERENDSDTYFYRNSDGTASDFILISDAAGGIVRVTPTTSDWSHFSDTYGMFVGEIKVTDSNSDIQFTEDIEINVQRAVV